MMKQTAPRSVFRPLLACALTAILGLSACAPAPAPQGINDPFEKQNRQVHSVNLVLDKNVIRPLASGASKVIPKPVSRGIGNFASNLGLPGEVANDILQLRLDRAGRNTWRFVINTTLGLGGILDPATAFGAAEKPTDFGETLHVWGVGEGAYVELPFYGPSTERDALGKLVDLGLDPVRILVPKNKGWIVTTAKIVSRIDERGRYSDTVDSILYDSADGYAQARLFYLEHRRHNLGQTTDDSEFEDPYAQ
jgi:phospholipid-binding lipoprotein MlaA